jgi:N-acetylglucosaminyl-diphospho-decaprenol L-rhamnosyltransferase
VNPATDCMTDAGTIVAVVSYNTREELRACLNSLRGCEHRVVVVDNGSTDGSADMVRADYPGAALLESPTNIGYGAAANRVFRRYSAEFLVLANSDVTFAPDAVAKLTGYLAQNPDVGLIGPRLVNPDGALQRSCFPLPGSVRWIFDNDVACALWRIVPGFRSLLLRLWKHDGERDVPWVKGAALAIRRSSFDDVNGFDESFFMYYEETDLCVRMARKGWRIRFAPVTEVIHSGGASTAKDRTAMAVEQFTSSMRFARRHHSRFHAGLLLWIWKAILLLRLLRDRARLVLCREEGRRKNITDDVTAWQRALLWRIRDLAERGHA